MGPNDLSKYAQLCTIIAALCGILSLLGLRYDLPRHYNDLCVYEKTVLLWTINLMFIFVAIIYFEIKLKKLGK